MYEIETFIQWYYEKELLTYGELDSIETLDDIQTILEWKRDQVFIADNIPLNKFTVKEYWLYLSILNDCIEYGTSPRGAWLTDKGTKILNILIENKQGILDEL